MIVRLIFLFVCLSISCSRSEENQRYADNKKEIVNIFSNFGNLLLQEELQRLDSLGFIQIMGFDSTGPYLDFFLQGHEEWTTVELPHLNLSYKEGYRVVSVLDYFQMRSFLVIQDTSDADKTWLYTFRGLVETWDIFCVDDMILFYGDGFVYNLYGGFIKGEHKGLAYVVHNYIMDYENCSFDASTVIEHMTLHLRAKLESTSISEENSYCNQPLNLFDVVALSPMLEGFKTPLDE